MSEVVKRSVGRPPVTEPSFSAEIADEICERLAVGESLKSICETEGFPTERTVNWRVKVDPEFNVAYARARKSQAEHFADELIDIADDGRNDFMRRATERGEEFLTLDREHLERSKTRIATRQWVIERILSNKYGPKPQVIVNNQQNIISIDPVEAARVYQKTINVE